MEQKAWKFNIIDALVMGLLVLGILFAGLRMFGTGDTSTDAPSQEQTYRVTFFAESVPASSVKYLSKGSSACNGDMNMDLGTIIDLQIGDSIVYVTLEDGTIVASSKPNYCSVTIVCELTGTQEEIGLKVGTYYLLVGHYMNVRSGNSEVYTYVTDIQSVKGA